MNCRLCRAIIPITFVAGKSRMRACFGPSRCGTMREGFFYVPLRDAGVSTIY